MSGDKFQKTQAGRPLEIPAPAWNAMIDAARAHADGQLNQGSPSELAFRQADIVKVRNQSGQDLDRFSVLGIDEPIILPSANIREFKNQVAINAVMPTDNHAGQFVVLLQPLKAGAIGRAWISGVCPVRVQMAASWHTHVDIEAANVSELVSKPDGGAQILWRGVGTWNDNDPWNDSQGWDAQTQWAIIRFSNIHRPHYVAKIPSGGIPPRVDLQTGTAQCELFTVGADGVLNAVTEYGEAIQVPVRNFSAQEIAEPDEGVDYIAVNWDGRDSWLADGSSPTNQIGGGSTIGVLFYLTSNLAPGYGNTASASVVGSGDPLTVISSGDFQSFAGCLGLAIQLGGQFWIVHVNQYALLSLATLSSDTHNLSTGPGTVGDGADQRSTAISSLAATSSYPHSFIPSPLPTIYNPHNLLGKSGDKATVVYNRAAGQWQLLKIHPASLRSFRFKLTSNFPAGLTSSTTDYTVESPVANHGGDTPSPLPAIKDSYSVAMNARSGDIGEAEYNWKTGGWDIVSIAHQATRFRGKLVSDFSSKPATFSVTPEKALDGTLPSGNQTVRNIYSWSAGLANKNVLVYWNPIDSQWEPMQMECP